MMANATNLEGDLAVSPSPNRKHQRIVLNSTGRLFPAVDHGLGELYTAPFDMILQ